VIVAGKQSQANKNYWAAYAIWKAKVAEARARRRAAEKARLEELRRAQKPPTAPPPSQPVLTPFMRFLLLLGISLLVVMASGSTVTSVNNRFAKPITVADSTIEESQSATHICYQFTRSTPFPFDDLLCGGVNVIENFDDVVRLADDIAERIVTGTMTSASNIRQLHDSNVLSFNYAHALNPSDEDSQENVLTDVGDLVGEDDFNEVDYYFRGTTEEYLGGAHTIELGITSTTTQPGVATVFAMVSETTFGGEGVVYIFSANGLANIRPAGGNVLAPLEFEEGFHILPNQLEQLSMLKITDEEAQAILSTMGFALTDTIIAQEYLSFSLWQLIPLTKTQISQFVLLAAGMGGLP